MGIDWIGKELGKGTGTAFASLRPSDRPRIEESIMSRTIGPGRRIFRSAPRGKRGIGLLLALALAASALSGCGKSDPRLQAWGGMGQEEWLAQYKQRKEQEQAEEKAAQEAAAAQRKADTEAAAARARKPRSASKAKGPDPNRSLEAEDEVAAAPTPAPASPPAVKTEYPAEFSDWTMEHFEKAWREQSPRFLPAVSALGALHVGDPTAAEKLGRLMDLFFEGKASSADPARTADDTLHLRGIVGGLLRNRTAVAEDTVLRGWRRVVDRRDAATARVFLETVFTAEAAASSRVFSAVADDIVRLAPSSDSQWLAEAVGGALPSADGDVRQAIWERISAIPDSPLRKTVLNVVTRAEDANIRLLLDVIATLPPDLQAQEWERAQEWNFSQWRLLLEGRRGASPVGLAASGGVLVGGPWTEEVAEKTSRALDRVVYLRESAGVVGFAATLPHPETRWALGELLRRRWTEEPQGILSSLEYADPGLIPVMKDVLREHQDSAVTRYGPRPVSTAARAQTGGAAPRRPREMPAAPLFASQGKTRWEYQAWLDETYALIAGWMDRLGEGAIMDRRRSWDAETMVGFAVHSAGCPGCAVSLAPLPARPDDVDSMKGPLVEVSYIRLADAARPAAVVSYYRRMISGARERPLPNGLWLDASANESDLRVSVDVRITAVAPGKPVQEQQDLIVEILRVQAAVASPEKSTVAETTTTDR
ncbi:hypothetical protein [Thermopirellula anaerolimosa]